MKKFVVYICLCLCVCLGFGFSLSQVTISAKDDVGYIFIGDSRTVGMKDTIESKGYTCIAEIGKGLGYLKSDCFNELKDKISTKTNIKKWKIISSFGVNDLGNVSDYAEYYKNLISKLSDGNEYTLYLVPVFKVNESIAHKKGYSKALKNSSIDNFNKKLKTLNNGSSIIFLSSLNTKSMQKKISKNLCNDGLHYTATGYKYNCNKILKAVKGNNSSDDDNDDSDDSGSALSTKEGKALLKKINQSMGKNIDYDILMSVYSALKTSKFSDYESSAILVNMARESEIRPDAEQHKGTWSGGVGLIQWDNRKDALENWSKSHCKNGDIITLSSGHKIGCIGCQVAFTLYELKGGQWGGKAPAGYFNIDINSANKDINDKSIDLTKRITVEEWRKMKNPPAMSLYFTSQFERCAYEIDIYTLGAKQSRMMYELIHGTTDETTKSESNKKANEQIADAMASSGLWSEADFNLFCSLTETDIEFPERDDLSQDQLKGVEDWKNNIEYEKGDNILSYIRVFVMLLGIIFLVWMVFIYLSYWFDRINNFIDIDFLPIVTGGRLRVSPEEHECTFNPKEFARGKPMTVNHRAVLTICFIGLFVAVLIITGKLYKILNFLVRTILGWLGLS